MPDEPSPPGLTTTSRGIARAAAQEAVREITGKMAIQNDEARDALHRRARSVEDYGMYVGLAIAALYGIGEFLVYISIVTPPEDRGVPWVTLVLFVGCVLPKTIGRVTTGKVWIIIANGVASWFSRKPAPTPPEEK